MNTPYQGARFHSGYRDGRLMRSQRVAGRNRATAWRAFDASRNDLPAGSAVVDLRVPVGTSWRVFWRVMRGQVVGPDSWALAS